MSLLPSYPLTRTKLAKLPETTLPLCEDDDPDDCPGWTKMSLRGWIDDADPHKLEGYTPFFPA
jgi:hypothetical protein